jgi:DNA-binding transcriptional LysR family regulator
MDDRFSDIGVFVEAVEREGFSAAAMKLNLSRSAVGKTIARLEERLGARLFHRTTRQLSLTEAGQIFYEHCRKALTELRAGAAQIESGQLQATGVLRVTLPVLYGQTCVVPVLLDLAREHPGLELDLHFNDRRVDIVQDGFDLAIRNGALDDTAGLMTRRLAHQRMTVCASPDYLAKHGRPENVADLVRYEAVVYGRGETARTWLFPRPDGSLEEILPTSRMHFDELKSILAAVMEGFGIGWLPCWLVHEHVRSGRLLQLIDKHLRYEIPCHALWPRSPHLPLKVRVAIDALADRLPGASRLPDEEIICV